MLQKVGIVGMGKGLDGIKAKSDTQVKSLELSQGKLLDTSHRYINSGSKMFNEDEISIVLEELKMKIVKSSLSVKLWCR